MNLLLVEDEVRVADFIRRGRKAEGWLVEQAGDGETALEFLRDRQFDAVILDLCCLASRAAMSASKCEPARTTHRFCVERAGGSDYECRRFLCRTPEKEAGTAWRPDRHGARGRVSFRLTPCCSISGRNTLVFRSNSVTTRGPRAGHRCETRSASLA